MQGNVKVQQKPVNNQASTNPSYQDDLVKAVKENNVKEIKFLLKAPQKGQLPIVSPCYTDKKGRNALHIAVEDGGSAEIIKLLVELDVPANAKDNDGYTPFHLAVRFDKVELVKALLDLKVNVKTCHDKGRSTIDSAITKKNDKIIALLLNYCPDVVEHFYPDDSKRANAYERMLNIAFDHDNLNLFKDIIINHSPMDHEALANLPENTKIKNFLSYKPGQLHNDIQSYILKKERGSVNLEKLFYDYCQSSEGTSSESSDYENEKFQILNQNKDEKNKILFRGFHFSQNHLRTTAERNAVINSNHDKPVYSLATTKLAEDHRKSLERADELVKGYFELLKITNDKPELKENFTKRNRQVGQQTKIFENLYLRFVHAYVNHHGYNELL